MAARTYRILTQISAPSGDTGVAVETTAEGDLNVTPEIPIGANTLVNVGIPYANLKAIFLLATVAMTLKTNDSGDPDDTIELAANVPLAWITGGTGSNPFTVDVAAIYVTAAAAGTLKIIGGYDPTPAV